MFNNKDFHKSYVALVIIFIAIFLIIILIFGRASVKREVKTMTSGFDNGLDRKITVYDYNGNKIRSWTGKFDVTQGETGLLFDDQDGRRVIITNGIVINEEIK